MPTGQFVLIIEKAIAACENLAECMAAASPPPKSALDFALR